ncbi:MAG: Gfo/Idh/MocA family oxidoreductase [Caldilineaceae bacterium]|nr:Gfo/Idh/MocA family oxidoreductase [Caldilineaceae bacterium]MBP8108510.1 Gfo/Idh/MocA family oxidoreductase [Caldilineaceae bacterium]MBP8123318.1 Gfo/Idh/MocA family oxidoreductase [Caldilineaceae bacterium]MBP9074321.1 Gfo/Idh/MocA family oxidoreductase [Caldilineaceae bacterium]
MRIGIVGTGFMGSTHAAGWAQTDAQIAGFVTKAPDEAEALIAKYGGQLYPDLAAMLNDVDIVDICAPTHRHFELVIQAAGAGKHILCEKPLGRTLEQAQEMTTACEAAGVKLMVAHVVRFFPDYAQAHRRVMAGEIGRPGVIRLSRESFQPKKAADNWFLDDAKSGGMVLDLMIHDLDYARWVAGPVTQVFAKSTGTHALAILTHVSGAISHVTGSWAYPPPTFRTAFEIAGEKGLITCDSESTAPVSLHLHRRGGDGPDIPVAGSPLSESPYTTEIKAFYDAVIHDKPVPVPGGEGVAAVRLALAVLESAKTGQPVTIAPEVNA